MLGPCSPRPADNPFASRRIDELGYRFRKGSMDEAVAILVLNRLRGVIVGPHGSGKTTLLEHLGHRLNGKMLWIRLSSNQLDPMAAARKSIPEAVDGRHTILIDGAEQLGPWSWWRLHRRIRRARAIVITSHRQGRLPTIYECTTDPALLKELVEELAPELIGAIDLDAIFQRHRGNIRLCFRELYDRWAGRGSVS